jgi:SAM-dependent methyltransferase
LTGLSVGSIIETPVAETTGGRPFVHRREGEGEMTAEPRDQRRLYDDLVWTWPIISPPDDYIEESEHFSRVIREYAGIGAASLLHLGCGGGHNDHTLNLHFRVTGVDLSPRMLELARRLNPEITYHEGDMRSVRLGERFDAVAILDSINCMLSEDDLRAAFETAFFHLRPGGVFLTHVEQTVSSFQQNRTTFMTGSLGDTEITFVENYYDPDPADTTYECTFVYLIRQRGELTIETDRHLAGLFPLDVWYDNLRRTGFDVRQLSFEDTNQQCSIPLLVGIKSA